MGPSLREVAVAAAGHQWAVGNEGVTVLPQDQHLQALGGPQGLRGQDVLRTPLGDHTPVEADEPRQVRGYRIEVVGREENHQPTGMEVSNRWKTSCCVFGSTPTVGSSRGRAPGGPPARGRGTPAAAAPGELADLPPGAVANAELVHEPSGRLSFRGRCPGLPRQPWIAPMRMTCSAAIGNRQSSASRLGMA